MTVVTELIDHDAAARNVDSTVPTDALRLLADAAVRADEYGKPDLDGVAILRSSGLLAMAVPNRHGGAGADAATLNRCIEQVARVNASAAIILFQHYAVTARISEWGTDSQCREILPMFVSGEWIAASAWSESGAGSNKRNLASVARPHHDGGWVLDGAKSFTTGAGIADIYLVLVRTADPQEGDETTYGAAGQTFFLVRGRNPGLMPDTSMSLAGMRGSATGFVSLQNCRVQIEDRLGTEGAAATIIAGVRDTGMTLGAVAVGVAQAAMDQVMEHSKARGALSSSALRHRLVDLATQVEAARAIVVRAGHRRSDDPGITTLHAKLFASTVAEHVCSQVLQLLGSAGYIGSHPVNRYARDARAVALMGPTNDLCRELVSATWTR